jgi:hypothetical protein
LDHKDQEDWQAQKDQLEILVFKDLREFQDPKERRDHKENPEFQALLVNKDLQEWQELEDHKAQEVMMESKDLQE